MKLIYFAGIDISKYKHDFCIISNTGELIVEHSSFENNQKGFQAFLDTLKPYNNIEVRIAFEATGHYSMNLELFLNDQGFDFMKINPIVINKFFKARSLRKTKTDKIDSLAIANYLSTVTYQPNSILLYQLQSLKSLCRSRDSLVRHRSKVAVDITNLLDLTFPEIKPFFGNRISTTLLYILEKYKNPKRISLIREHKTLTILSRGRFTYPKFVRLKTLAKNTVGSYNENTDLLLDTYVSLYRILEDKIKPIEDKISTIIKELIPPILTIPGIGEITAACILSEYGDISLFSTPAKMLAFAGLEPSIIQSGTMEHGGRMVKRGSGHLRYVLMNAAHSVVKYNPVFYDFYLKKINEGKSHRVALSHVSKKLIRVIHALETKNIKFDPSFLK